MHPVQDVRTDTNTRSMTVRLLVWQNEILLRTEPIWPQRYHHIYKHYKCALCTACLCNMQLPPAGTQGTSQLGPSSFSSTSLSYGRKLAAVSSVLAPH